MDNIVCDHCGKKITLGCMDSEYSDFSLHYILWKWKIVLCAVLVTSGLIAWGYISWGESRKKCQFTAQTDIQIGKIANVNIEGEGDIYAYLMSDQFINGDKQLEKLNVSFNGIKNVKYPKANQEQFQKGSRASDNSISIIHLSLKGDSNEVESKLKNVVEKFMTRHKTLYDDGVVRFEEIIRLCEEDPEDLPGIFFRYGWLTSYTYETRVIRSVKVSKDAIASKPNVIFIILMSLTAFTVALFCIFMRERYNFKVAAESKKS